MQAAEAAISAWGLHNPQLTPVTGGLINLTYFVDTAEARWVLQRLNSIFTPRVHEDIEAVTTHISRKGLVTPRLLPTPNGALWHESQGEIWRVMSFVSGFTQDKLTDTADAKAAGQALGTFHLAVADLEHDFKNRRLGVHDTPKHLANLKNALATQAQHPNYTTLAPLLAHILADATALSLLPPVPDRIVHGDPKISNLIFKAPGAAHCWVDLDTLARMPIFLELGDAFRSWCNPSGEDATQVQFDLDLFRAAVTGYAEGAQGYLLPAEQQNLVTATRTIILELAARFGADALNESYFGWDPSRYRSRSEHNEVRARGQLALAQSLEKLAPDAEAIVRQVFASA